MTGRIAHWQRQRAARAAAYAASRRRHAGQAKASEELRDATTALLRAELRGRAPRRNARPGPAEPRPEAAPDLFAPR